VCHRNHRYLVSILRHDDGEIVVVLAVLDQSMASGKNANFGKTQPHELAHPFAAAGSQPDPKWMKKAVTPADFPDSPHAALLAAKPNGGAPTAI
jgi:hypothetical protein